MIDTSIPSTYREREKYYSHIVSDQDDGVDEHVASGGELVL
jgi:hypothetical protein